MKKARLVTAALCLLVTIVKAQQSVLFKVKYLPDHLYESVVKMNTNMEMNIVGDQGKIDRIKASGYTLPMVVSSSTSISVSTTSGAITARGSFPLIIRYIDMKSTKTISGKDVPQPENPLLGHSIYATSSPDGNLQIDSIPGKVLNAEFKATLAKTIANMVNQLNFPEKPISIGESFTREAPINLPIAGINLQFAIKIIYKLTAINNNLASFDMDQSLSFDMNTKKGNVTLVGKGTGTGNGKMTYDITQSYSTNISNNFSLDFNIKIEDTTMEGKAKVVSTHETKVTDKTK